MTLNNNRHLILCFSSFVIPRDASGLRMEEYAICYEQLKRVIPNNFDLIFIDNTVSHIIDIKNSRLVGALGDTPCLFYNHNIGLQNKGLCSSTLEEVDTTLTSTHKVDSQVALQSIVGVITV